MGSHVSKAAKVLSKLFGAYFLMRLSYNIARVFFRRRRASRMLQGLPGAASHPFWGSLPIRKENAGRMPDFIVETLQNNRAETIQFEGPLFREGHEVMTIEARNIKHILKDNVNNYIKMLPSDKGASPNTNFLFKEWLGEGIFAVNHGDADPHDNAKWQLQRKVASTIFTRGNFTNFMRDVFVEKGHTFLKILDNTPEGERVDMQEKFFQYTMDSIMFIFFGRVTDTIQGEMDEFAQAFDAIQRFQIQYFDFFPLIILSEILPWPVGCSQKGGDGLLMKWHRGTNHCAVEWKKCNDTLTRVSHEIVNQKRSDPDLANKKDLLARFMNASTEDGVSLSDPSFQNLMRDIVLSLIIAGRDTTACTLTWAFYLLSQNPTIQQELIKEIDSTLLGAEPTYENVSSLTYLHGVIYETLRLYPPVPSDFKIAVDDDVLPDGTKIPKFTRVNYVPYACGRNAGRYENPEVMKPERWFKYDEVEKRKKAIIPNQYAFPVFQAGPRICLGMNMALMETKIVIVMLLQKYTFTIPDEEVDKITYSRMITLSLKNGPNSHSLWMNHRKRQGPPSTQ